MSALMDNPPGNVAMWLNQYDSYHMRNDANCAEEIQGNYMGILQFPKAITAARLPVRELRRLHEQGDVSSLARVVMPDHLHWLIQLNERWSLSRVVKTLKARSALSINRHLCQQGSLWQRAYYDRAARKDEDIRGIARYIVANPLRAGLVRNIGDYPHWDCIWMTDDDETPLVE